MNNKICEVCSKQLIKQQERFCSKDCQHRGHRVKNPVWTKEFAKEYSKKYREKHKEKLSAQSKKWRNNNPARVNKNKRKERENLKMEVLGRYSGNKICCAICGFDDTRALQIDHIDNNGAEERREVLGNRLCAGTTFYRWVRRQNYPEGYQVLCANCNIIKLREFEKTKWR